MVSGVFWGVLTQDAASAVRASFVLLFTAEEAATALHTVYTVRRQQVSSKNTCFVTEQKAKSVSY